MIFFLLFMDCRMGNWLRFWWSIWIIMVMGTMISFWVFIDGIVWVQPMWVVWCSILGVFLILVEKRW